MVLPIATEIHEKPSLFVERIICSFPSDRSSELVPYLREYYTRFPHALDYEEPFPPKLHVILLDQEETWKPGVMFLPVIHNDTELQFQFAPAMRCLATQVVTIDAVNHLVSIHENGIVRTLDQERLSMLCENEGFDSLDDFFGFFQNFGGARLQIVHWTDLLY